MKKVLTNIGYWILLIFFIIVVRIVGSLIFQPILDSTSETGAILKEEIENRQYVQIVKDGSPVPYPDKTYGKAFENYFANPSWKYFVGIKESTDEDGDGKPDEIKNDVDVVEFTGKCTYRGAEVTARIQFVLDIDQGTFDATYLSFNDIPQTMALLNELLVTVFSDGDDSSVQTETATEQSVQNVPQASNEELANNTKQSKPEQTANVSQEKTALADENLEYPYYDASYLFDISNNNVAHAKQLFVGGYIAVGGFLQETDTDSIELAATKNNALNDLKNPNSIELNYYSKSFYCIIKNSGLLDEIVNMNRGDAIVVRGKVTDIDTHCYYMTVDDIYKVDSDYRNTQSYDMPEEDEPLMWEDEVDEYILPTDTEYITKDDLAPYSKEEVSLIRNEIYARYGYNFQNETIRNYFMSQTWYYPVEGVDANTLGPENMNKYERSNLETIMSYEKEMGWK